MIKSTWDANEVFPGLWVGSRAAAENESELLSRNIVAVLTVASKINPQLAWNTAKATSSISCKCFDIEDNPSADLLEILPSALRFIDSVIDKRAKTDEVSASILVHCASGMSRSVAVCIAWLMLRQRLSLKEAMKQVKESRVQANPNFGFLQALHLLEEQGSIKAAHAFWMRANKDSERGKDVQKLREAAQSLSRKACQLEEYAKALSTSDLQLKKLKAYVSKLLKEAGQQGLAVDDSNAHEIRSDAVRKLQNLKRVLTESHPELRRPTHYGPTLIVTL
jgi:protein-tyrosine phosphatase